MSRLTLDDTAIDAAVKLCEGNPGALTVLHKILKDGDKIDPEAWSGSLATLFAFDTLEIYGPRIWMLYKDVCGQDLVKMLAVLRAVQLGITSAYSVTEAIDGRLKLDVDDLLQQVKSQLKEFGNVV